MTVLHDERLDELARAGAIDPYDPSQLQPASIDCRLGTTFRVPVAHRHSQVDLAKPIPDDLYEVYHDQDYWVVQPNSFVLGRTLERITVPKHMVARLEGKSSLARIGLIVHVTGGYFDPGFSGYGTLEFVNLFQVPIVLRVGLPICQFSFHLLTGESRGYAGRYQDGNDAVGSRYGHLIRGATP